MRNLKNILTRSNYRKCNSRTVSTKVLKNQQKWNSVVGLEVHAQISSESKLFSRASTDFGKPVNSSVSFFDCASPGTLPALNRKCVEAGVRTALALSCEVNKVSLFDRKHYFYSDLPAGYQITQQRQPLAVDGELGFNVFTPGIHKEPYAKSSKIKQIQLEQDSGKSLHDELRGWSLVDLNRAGIPLMELVFEPDLADGEEAAALVKELIIILQRLNTCSCKMQEGALRVDANISVHKPGEPLGVRTEVKNIGSIRGVAGAIKYEIERQIKMLESGSKIINETLSWDASSQTTVSMRDKEEKQDYRFMPEPNLPPLRLHVDKNKVNNLDLVDVNSLMLTLPKLPEEIRQSLKNDHGLPTHIAIIIVSEQKLLQLYEEIMQENSQRIATSVANLLVMELLEFLNKNKLELDTLMIPSKSIGELVDLTQAGDINLTTVKKVLNEMQKDPSRVPAEIVEEHQWLQINDETELIKICQVVLDQNLDLVQQYKKGKKKVLRAILGKIASECKGRANMAKVTIILENLLK